MPERRGTRFVVEVLFLAALATTLAFAHLTAAEIVGAMAVGWIIVAALEWAAWRGEPHYGSGLPPKYFVPSIDLPSPHPLEQVERGYPEAARDEAPTWIASAALRAEMLGEWPHAPLAPEAEEEEEEAEEAFASALDADADPWTVAALPAAPLDEEESASQSPATTVARRTAPIRTPGAPKALYRFEPLGDVGPRRRFRRGAPEPAEGIEVDARPSGPRALPSHLR